MSTNESYVMTSHNLLNYSGMLFKPPKDGRVGKRTSLLLKRPLVGGFRASAEL